MKHYKLNTIAAVVAGLLCASRLSAADLTMKEQTFIKDAVALSLAESKVGEVAQKKARRPEVREFATMVVEHHGSALAELRTLANAKSVKYDDALSLRHAAAVDRFNKIADTDFDKEFLDQVVSDHEKAARDFEDVSRSSNDAGVKALIDKMLPVLRSHLEKARALEGGK